MMLWQMQRQKLAATLQRFTPPAWQQTYCYTQPLLSTAELLSLQQRAAAADLSHLTALREVQHPLLGEKDSAFAGSGYEFAEHRQYVSGDPVKHINWRIYARTGQLVRKVFHEQRRPQLYLVVDRRAAMRFGTRAQLKVTCAVKHALMDLYQAQILQLHIGAAILDEKLIWHPAKQGQHSTQTLIEQLVAPCPPLMHTAEKQTRQLDETLDLLAVQLSAGSLIFIFSDFLDYQDSMNNRLLALGQQHTVIAHHIIDIAETELPPQGHYLIQDSGSNSTIDLNCSEPHVRKSQQQILQQHIEKVKSALQIAQIQYQRIDTAADTL